MKISSQFYTFLSKHSYLLPVGIFGLTIAMLLLTLLPSDFMGQSQLWSYDKLGHSVLFGAWCFTLGLYFQVNKNYSINIWAIFAGGVFFGLLIEILQYSLPLNRHGDPVDFLFDVLGCLIAVLVLKRIRPEQTVPAN